MFKSYRMVKTRYGFRKSALTKGFKNKWDIAQFIFSNWPALNRKIGVGGYENYGTFKDVERGVTIDVYLGRKVKGVGATRPIRCRLNYNSDAHPDLKNKALSLRDLKFYHKELLKASQW